jgi:hypothetical protein
MEGTRGIVKDTPYRVLSCGRVASRTSHDSYTFSA